MSDFQTQKSERTQTTPTTPTIDLDRDSGPSVGAVVGSVARTALSLIPGAGLFGALGADSNLSEMYALQEQLLQRQMEMQMVSQQFSTLSNVQKMDHDTRMNTIRSFK